MSTFGGSTVAMTQIVSLVIELNYLYEGGKGFVVFGVEYFLDLYHVHFTPGYHHTNQSPVICAKTLNKQQTTTTGNNNNNNNNNNNKAVVCAIANQQQLTTTVTTTTTTTTKLSSVPKP